MPKMKFTNFSLEFANIESRGISDPETRGNNRNVEKFSK
jgi:hypothetical protein